MDLISYDNLVRLSKPKEQAITRDQEAYKKFRTLLDANERLYNSEEKYSIRMRYISNKTKEYYNSIKNELMSYVALEGTRTKVRYELREKAEVFYLDNVIAQIKIEKGTLYFGLNHDPTKLKVEEGFEEGNGVSDITESLAMIKIHKDHRAQEAVAWVQELMRKYNRIKNNDYIKLDYASFFTRDGLFASRRLIDSKSGEASEVVVTITQQSDLKESDVLKIQPVFSIFNKDITTNEDDEEFVQETEDHGVVEDSEDVSESNPSEYDESSEEPTEDEEPDDEDDSSSQGIVVIPEQTPEDTPPEEESDVETEPTPDEQEGTLDQDAELDEDTSESQDDKDKSSDDTQDEATALVAITEDGDSSEGNEETSLVSTTEENKNLEEVEEEKDEDEEEEEEEEDVLYVYRNVSSARERPMFREISGKRKQVIDESYEKKSIFTESEKKEPEKAKKKNLWRELAEYGYDFVLLKQLLFYTVAIALGVTLGLIYKLKWPFILAIVVFVLLSVRGVLLAYYRNKYEEKKYRDAESYIEQMLYSFRRNSKILVSLKDALVVFPNGYMHNKILEAIDYIQHSRGEGNVYANALAIIEEAYPCRRIKSLHRYMIKVEGIGGKHESGINALLKDRRQWIDRTAAFRNQCETITKEILISGIFSLAMACIILYMLPNDLYDLSSSIVYQIVTTVFVIVNLLLIRITLKSTVIYLQDDDEEQAKKTLRLLKWLRNYDDKVESRKAIKQSILFIAVAIIGFFMRNLLIMLLGVAFTLFGIFVKRHMDYRSAKKRLCREIEKVYPDWLLEMALLLQSDNVHNAIEKSLDTSPLVLRADLRKLSDDLVTHPTDLGPYIGFFDFLPLANVRSSMKLLYSISIFGAVDESVQISELVERNHTLMEQAERLRNNDKLALVFSIKFIPMLSSSIKMLVDLMLFLFSYISLIGVML